MEIGAGIYKAVGDRGNDSVHKTELRTGGRAGLKLSEFTEPYALGLGCRLFCSRTVGYRFKAQGHGRLRIESG